MIGYILSITINVAALQLKLVTFLKREAEASLQLATVLLGLQKSID